MANKPVNMGLGIPKLLKYGTAAVVGTVSAMIARPYIREWIHRGPIEADILDEEVAYEDLLGFEENERKKKKKKKGKENDC